MAAPSLVATPGAHPNSVDRLVMLSPGVRSRSPRRAGARHFGKPATNVAKTRKRCPRSGTSQVQCADQVDPAIRQAIWQEGLLADGVSWAPGMRRVPTFPTFFWNRTLATRLRNPTLIIEGDNDAMAPVSMPDAIRAAFTDVGSPSKVYAELPCSSHFAMWETRHLAMFEASRDWLRDGQVNGSGAGEIRLGH